MILFSVCSETTLAPLRDLTSHWVRGLLRVQSNCPPLKTRVSVHVALKNLKRDALLSEALGECKAAHAGSDNENVHAGDYLVDSSCLKLDEWTHKQICRSLWQRSFDEKMFSYKSRLFLMSVGSGVAESRYFGAYS